MIDHLTLTVRDLAKSRTFYEQALAPLGYSVVMEFGPMFAFGPGRKPVLWMKQGEPQAPMHLAFAAPDAKSVDAFYKAAITAGGADDGPPGPRIHYHPQYYGAFVKDPDGHPVEAVTHGNLFKALVPKAVAPRPGKKKAAPSKKAPAMRASAKVASRSPSKGKRVPAPARKAPARKRR
jgi:catechol 2,3-dioxygenase-like lactoylglutathione lyase family enzyme